MAVNDFVKRSRFLIMLCLLSAALLVLAACGGGDEEDGAATEATSTTTSGVAASPTTAAVSAPSPTTAPTNTVAASPTEDQDEATATVEATATATEQEEDESPTADTGSATSTGEEALGEIGTIDPEALPNYTMNFNFEMTGLADQEDTTISLLIEQAALDNYYMLVNTDGTEVEVWQVGETSFVSQGGTGIVEVPAGSGQELFDPSLFLQSLPPFPPEMNVQEEGTEEVDGREARRYSIAGEDYLAASELGDVSQLSNIEGGVEILVDDELNILLLMNADITWTNPDGTEGGFIGLQEITDIGSTGEIAAPQ